MPYIKREKRLDIISERKRPETAGELNFQLTRVINKYLMDRSGYSNSPLEYGKEIDVGEAIKKTTSYQTINDIIGALEGAKLEFYARVVRPYEDKKCQENGDVY